MPDSADDQREPDESVGCGIVPIEEDDELAAYAKRVFSPKRQRRERRLFRAFWHSAPAMLLAFGLSTAAHASGFCGTVVSVVDGDTEWVHTTSGQNVKIRLHIADAPEVRHNSRQVDQPYGPEASQLLASLTLGKTVCADIRSYSYSRPVVDLTVSNMSVNDAMIDQGAAWADPRYDRSHEGAALEAQAKAAGRGLWALPNPIPPWQWRKDHGIR